ncbi:hypothetical protein BESB_033780 [Besnoitia besnoiti]|uniref:SRS domain-containing protein n=1 Tax=Besnoitia besnoiti TaxID=94643 RepID=A0A2A9MMT3_BESBE|nr:hypothetical protein BESB_033780 [Besnoitia besnoiti]PFH36920.1 hypothetical protein BESB_033780 [Besnoitia besnoiti]
MSRKKLEWTSLAIISLMLLVTVLPETNALRQVRASGDLHPAPETEAVCDLAGSASPNKKQIALTKTMSTISFSCGKQAQATLSPPVTAQWFATEAGCPPTKFASLKADWGDGAVLKADSKDTDGVAKTYKLTVPATGRKPGVLYYCCSLEDNRVVESPTASVAKAAEPKSPKTCSIVINVEAGEGQMPPAASGTEARQGGAGDSTAVSVEVCDPRAGGQRRIDMTLASDAKTITFNCGSSRQARLTPAASANQFCVDSACYRKEDLSILGNFAQLFSAEAEDKRTVYTLSISRKPDTDTKMYYMCAVKSKAAGARRAGLGSSQRDKHCLVKITVKGQTAPNPSAAGLMAASAAAVHGLLRLI